MKLTCKTRGDSSPQGKPRVWYTGHPAEAEAFAPEIFADIFKTQNCAIYYDAEPNADYTRDDLRELAVSCQEMAAMCESTGDPADAPACAIF